MATKQASKRGAPPRGRRGRQATNAGRIVSAGVSPAERSLSSRTSPYELWAQLRLVKTSDVGHERLCRIHGSTLDDAAHRRIQSYLAQAETFYLSAQNMHPESRPLVAYYFVLNLTKAFLTCVDPKLTARKVTHGLNYGYKARERYRFQHEQMNVGDLRPRTTSAFRELALHTGAGFCYPPKTPLPIHKLGPYLPETADLFRAAVDLPTKLVPLESVKVWFNGKETWLRVEANQTELREHECSPASFPQKARHFGSVFSLVSSDVSTASYESIQAFPYGGKRVLFQHPALVNEFERSLIHTNRGSEGSRYLAVVSGRDDLLSQEAVCFAVMHHLSSMVRYQPEHVAKLASQKWYFLLTSWVPRAMENFYLALASRILKEEIRIG